MSSDENDSDDDLRAMDSDSDDDDDGNYGRRLPRARYTTFGGDDAEEYTSSRRRRKDEATYGVFLNDSDDEGRPLRTRKRTTKSSSSRSTPMFVKGETQTDFDTTEDDDDEKESQEKAEDKSSATSDGAPPAEPTEEELELQRKRDEANQHFLSLLNRGRGKRRRVEETRETPLTEESTTPGIGAASSERQGGLGFDSAAASASAATSSSLGQGGLGLGASVSSSNQGGLGLGMQALGGLGLGMPSNFGQAATSEPPKKKDPNLGKWEKHTKGFGGKMLAKMGYTGSGGLGKRAKTGISKPVEVKVRPSNLGLGFGNFKEASQLKVNRQIEAEVRGVKVDSEEKKKNDAESSATTSSLLPSVNDMMKQESWRKGSKKGSRSRGAHKIIPYTELLKNKESAPIIDMRGPTKTEVEAEGSKEVPLAEELLHNVSLLLSTYETKTYSAAHFVKLTEQKVKSLESDVSSMQNRMEQGQDRIAKLERVTSLLDQIGELSKETDTPLDAIQQLVQQIGNTFTSEERSALKFSSIIVPSLLGNLVQSKLTSWKPLRDSLERSEALIRTVLSVGPEVMKNVGSEEDAISMSSSMLKSHILPRVKAAFESNDWNPVVLDTVTAVSFYELFYRIVTELDEEAAKRSNGIDDENFVLPTEDERPKLSDLVRKEIVYDSVYTRLSRSLSQWKARIDESNKLVDRLDLWIMPWLPHLDHPALLPSLVSECRRKTKSAVSLLANSSLKDGPFYNAVIETLLPWRGLFKEKNMNEMIASYVTPRLARSLSKVTLDLESSSGRAAVETTLRMLGLGLLSAPECLSLLEGEAMVRLTSLIHTQASEMGKEDATKLVGMYCQWKKALLQQPVSNKALNDEMLCRYFYAILLMIRAVADGNSTALDDLLPSTTNYRVVLLRRMAEEKRKAADDLVRMESGVADSTSDMMEAKVRLRQSGTLAPTFREVVAEFARERDILFQPRMGSNATKDGKQVFLFGDLPVYLDSNVVFAYNESEWKPMALEDLATLAKAST